MQELNFTIGGEARTPEDFFGFGQSVIVSVVTQLARHVKRDEIRHLARGLFSGAMAGLQTVAGDQETREAFERFMDAKKTAAESPASAKPAASPAMESVTGTPFECGIELARKRLHVPVEWVMVQLEPGDHEAFAAGMLASVVSTLGIGVSFDELLGLLDATTNRMRDAPAALRDEHERRRVEFLEQHAARRGSAAVH